MTHPTLGPLFGSFKLQHFIFTAGFRLYNSWLHNNRTGIGMKMSSIRFPLIYRGYNIDENQNAKNNPSSLYSYIGWKGSRDKAGGDTSRKNAIPVLMYLDIFKNYFANTQEENFYMIAGNAEASVTFNEQGIDTFTVKVEENKEYAWIKPIDNTTKLIAIS